MTNEHIFQWRVIHSLCAVVRLVNELRNAVESVSRATTVITGEDPYQVDGFAVEVLAHVQALCDMLPVLDASVPVRRVQRGARRGPSHDVSRETYPAPFMGPDSVEEADDA